MTNVRKINKLLDKPLLSLSRKDWRRVERWFPDEFAWIMVQLEPGRFPYCRDYYRVRAEAAHDRREMADRLASSTPFEIAAGAR